MKISPRVRQHGQLLVETLCSGDPRVSGTRCGGHGY